MRILDVCAFYSPQGGGVRTYVQRKMKAAAALGHEVIILAPGACDEIVERHPNAVLATISSPVLPLDRRYRYFGDEAALHAALDKWRPDIIEASSPWASAAMVARWKGTAFRALVMHADPLSAYAYRWFKRFATRQTIDWGFSAFWNHLRRLDREFDLVVTAGEDFARRLRAGGLQKVATVPMGVEPGIFSPQARDEALRAALLKTCGLGPDATLLIGLGRLAAEKRWPMVVDAATAAGNRCPLGLILIGTGPQEDRIQRAIGDNPHIKLFPPVQDRPRLAKLLASADALVHGCEAETFCMVAAEGRASGLPLIVPDCGGAADQFSPGRGQMYRASDGAHLRDQFLRFTMSAPHLHRSRAAADATRVRAMDEHFEDLFSAYGAQRIRLAA